jgi:hypothetical protein
MTRQRLLLIALMLWGIFMVAPDLLRIVKPLSSFGFYANNDGLIYDVEGPFNHKSESPAWKAGVRAGDRVDLERMRCRRCACHSGRRGIRAAGADRDAVSRSGEWQARA